MTGGVLGLVLRRVLGPTPWESMPAEMDGTLTAGAAALWLAALAGSLASRLCEHMPSSCIPQLPPLCPSEQPVQ